MASLCGPTSITSIANYRELSAVSARSFALGPFTWSHERVIESEHRIDDRIVPPSVAFCLCPRSVRDGSQPGPSLSLSLIFSFLLFLLFPPFFRRLEGRRLLETGLKLQERFHELTISAKMPARL